jgi:hypothetical protein
MFPRVLLACALSATFPLAALAQRPTDEEKEFLYARRVKLVLDPKSKSLDFKMAISQVAQHPKGFPVLLQAAELYGKERAKDKQSRVRWQEALRHIVLHKDGPSQTPEALIPDLVELLDKKSAAGLAPVVRFLGAMGPKAKAAIPALEKVRDGPNEQLALAALRAIKEIRGQK